MKKYYFNLQLMSMCIYAGADEPVPVSDEMFQIIKAFGRQCWYLDIDFNIINGLAMPVIDWGNANNKYPNN